MTPMNRTTRQNINDRSLSEQHYLHLYGGQLVFGYFPWDGKVIVVGFDGSRPDSLERIQENSVRDLLTVEEARQHWNVRISSGYTPVAPKEWNKIMNRGVVYGMALDFCRAEATKEYSAAIKGLSEIFNKNHKPEINRTYKNKYEIQSKYEVKPPTTYALEA